MILRKICAWFVCLCLLTSCGGGGGGGGSGGSHGRPSSGFRVLHANIDAPALDIYGDSGASFLGTIHFGESSGYLSNAAQPVSVSLATANVPSEVQVTRTISLEQEPVQTLLFYGDGNNFGIRAVAIDDPSVTADSGMALVRVIHGAVGAAAISASIGGTAVTDSTRFGEASEYTSVAAGTYPITVRRGTDGALLVNRTETVEAGKVYSLLVAGDAGYLAVGRLVVDN